MKPTDARRVRLRQLPIILVVALAAALAPAGAAGAGDTRPYIVQLRQAASVATAVGRARDQLGVRPERTFQSTLRGYSARLSGAQRTALLRDPNVVAVVPDEVVTYSASQSVPPGITRVGADPSAVRAISGNDPTLNVDIAILDTGITPHPDLRVAGGHDCTTSNTSAWQDGEKHGTHVAGIAAARDNGIGVVGVAPGARLWAVKVMDGTGTGLLSWVICGLEWVATTRDPARPKRPLIEVANMSIWAKGADDGNCGADPTTAHDLLHRAICRVNRANITVVASAANESMDAANGIPGSFGETITVGAICDSDGRPGGNGPACATGYADDAFARFSNYGRAVDLVAPGVAIVSTFPNGYGPISGTSMAAPHVAGGAALYYLHEASVGRPRPKPEDVRAGLIAAASDDWRTGTYPLGAAAAPPLLDVSSFASGADFRIGVAPAGRLGGAGENVFFDLWVGRIGGFNGGLNFEVSGLPDGASWTLGEPTVESRSGRWQRLNVSLPDSDVSGSHQLLITASAPGIGQRTARAHLQFDGGYSVGDVPRLNLRPVAVPPSMLPVHVGWPRVSGADRYQLQVSREGGPWETLVEKRGTGHSTKVWPRATMRYRVRARRNGEWGAWQTSPAYVATGVMAQDAPVVLSGQWQQGTSAQGFNPKIAYSTQAGAKLRVDFTGRSISWIAPRGPKKGRAAVYVDGVLVATVDLYSSRRRHRQTIFRTSWATPGAHRLEIEVLGTSGRPRVDIDTIAFIEAD